MDMPAVEAPVLDRPGFSVGTSTFGPAGFSGSLVVAQFDSLDAARAWANADPYCAAGVYARVEVRPFRKVLP